MVCQGAMGGHKDALDFDHADDVNRSDNRSRARYVNDVWFDLGATAETRLNALRMRNDQLLSRRAQLRFCVSDCWEGEQGAKYR
jgi:hypothetical protein